MNTVHEYCPECGEFVEAKPQPFCEAMPVRELVFDMENVYPVCPECGGRIASARYVNDALHAAYARYCEEKGLPTSADIVATRKRCGLSQAAFAKALGLGVASIQRYEKGSLPIESHAQLLKLAQSDNYLSRRIATHASEIGGAVADRALSMLASKGEVVNYYCIPWNGAEALDAFASLKPFEENGFRQFDKMRMASIARLLAEEVANLYVTRFSKVLFYLDFCSFKRRGVGFSGLRYVKTQYGPSPESYEQLYAGLIAYGAVESVERGDGQVVATTGKSMECALSDEDSALANAVAEFANSFKTTRSLGLRALREYACRQTKEGGLIEYRHAASLSI